MAKPRNISDADVFGVCMDYDSYGEIKTHEQRTKILKELAARYNLHDGQVLSVLLQNGRGRIRSDAAQGSREVPEQSMKPAVQAVLAGADPQTISTELGVPKHKLEQLVSIEQNIIRSRKLTVGENEGRTTMQKYDAKTKDAVIKAVILEGLTQSEAAERFGVHIKSISHWVVEARKTRQQFINSADEILAELPACATPSAPEVLCEIKEPVKCMKNSHDEMQSNIDQAAQKLHAETTLQLRLNEVDNAVSSLQTSLSCLRTCGLVDDDESDMLGQLFVRSQAFRAGMLYASMLEV